MMNFFTIKKALFRISDIVVFHFVWSTTANYYFERAVLYFGGWVRNLVLSRPRDFGERFNVSAKLVY